MNCVSHVQSCECARVTINKISSPPRIRKSEDLPENDSDAIFRMQIYILCVEVINYLKMFLHDFQVQTHLVFKSKISVQLRKNIYKGMVFGLHADAVLCAVQKGTLLCDGGFCTICRFRFMCLAKKSCHGKWFLRTLPICIYLLCKQLFPVSKCFYAFMQT